jgi:outer membrane protein assembly factor BamB
MNIARVLPALSFAFTTLAADWPQWHGPNRDNISAETSLLAAWPDGGPPLAWKINGIGAGFSGVSVANGRIFTMGDIGDDACVTTCDFNTGKKLWQTRIGKAGQCGNHYGLRATPNAWNAKRAFDYDRSKKSSWPHLVINNGKLFVRDQDLLLCYDIRKK